EHDHKVHSANAGLAMNFSTDVIQEVTELNLDLHAGAGVFDRRADKLVRDAIIWSHLAGDSVQRMKATRRLGKEGVVALGTFGQGGEQNDSSSPLSDWDRRFNIC